VKNARASRANGRWLGFALLGAWAGLAGCVAAAPTSAYTPIPGVQVLGPEITASQSCGLGPNQIFQYAAVLSALTADGGADGPPIASAVLPCSADVVFSNLDAAIPSFQVTVRAYNQCSFPSALACLPAPSGSAPCPGENPALVTGADIAGAANWTMTCTAQQSQGITAVASCGPLLPTDAGPSCPDAGE
jgi:hypothetical protein